jgi:hypothetical protein
MKNLFYILLILSSCSIDTDKNQLLINNYVEKQYLFTISTDSASIIIDNTSYDYQIIGDTLRFWSKTNKKDLGNQTELEPPLLDSDTFTFLINHYDNDSLILQSLGEFAYSFYDSLLRFYPKDALIDTTIDLKSISFKYGTPLSGFVKEALYLNENKIYGRIDTGRTFRDKTLDFYTNNRLNNFDKIQEKVRLINIESFDTIFPRKYLDYHSYWIVKIQYNNSEKIFKGVDLPSEFREIYSELRHLAYISDNKNLCDTSDKNWLRLIEPEEDILFDYDK